MRITLFVALLILGPAGLGIAYADSDGYYCVGRGYIAYQFGMAPEPVRPHHLYVLRIGTSSGIPEPVAIELPQFQVHGLHCDAGWVDVAAFTAIYRVTLDETATPSRYEVRPLAEGQRIPPEFFPQRNLGMGSPGGRDVKPARVSLGMKTDGGQYFLEMTGQSIPSERCQTSLTSRIVETDRNGREIRERVIFQGRGRLECGERRQVARTLLRSSSCDEEPGWPGSVLQQF